MQVTKDYLKGLKPSTIFAQGLIPNCPETGIYMTDYRRGDMLRWVAVRGFIEDWTIYCDFEEKNIEAVRKYGNKVVNPDNIRKLVQCDDEAFKLYRF
jgi:hypothetical protein